MGIFRLSDYWLANYSLAMSAILIDSSQILKLTLLEETRHLIDDANHFPAFLDPGSIISQEMEFLQHSQIRWQLYGHEITG